VPQLLAQTAKEAYRILEGETLNHIIQYRGLKKSLRRLQIQEVNQLRGLRK
jgi:hypothetical protein